MDNLAKAQALVARTVEKKEGDKKEEERHQHLVEICKAGKAKVQAQQQILLNLYKSIVELVGTLHRRVRRSLATDMGLLNNTIYCKYVYTSKRLGYPSLGGYDDGHAP